MIVYDYNDYKECINDWIAEQPKGGHGHLRRLAGYLNVNSVVMSQVFRGERHITMEQGVGVAKYIGLPSKDRDFFLLLVQKARAGSKELVDIIDAQIQVYKQKTHSLKNRIKHDQLTEHDRARFYSHWYYSAIRLGLSIEGINTVAGIADRLKLDRGLVSSVVSFLLEHKLVVEKNGKFDLGLQVTHVGHDSPFVYRHHTNWRMKALQAMDQSTQDHLFYTGPMALSVSAAAKIRNEMMGLIERATKLASESESEVLACLNLDWFTIA